MVGYQKRGLILFQKTGERKKMAKRKRAERAGLKETILGGSSQALCCCHLSHAFKYAPLPSPPFPSPQESISYSTMMHVNFMLQLNFRRPADPPHKILIRNYCIWLCWVRLMPQKSELVFFLFLFSFFEMMPSNSFQSIPRIRMRWYSFKHSPQIIIHLYTFHFMRINAD